MQASKHTRNSVFTAIALLLTMSGCKPQTETLACNDQGQTTYQVESELMQFQGAAPSSVETENGSFHLVKQQVGDINLDGKTDQVAVIVSQPGGSGAFYYLAASVAGECGTKPVESVFMGDRIQVGQLQILGDNAAAKSDQGLIIVWLGVHAPDRSMAERPKLQVSRMYQLQQGKLIMKDAM